MRYEEIVELRARGHTLKTIGERFSISRQRVQQILLKGKPGLGRRSQFNSSYRYASNISRASAQKMSGGRDYVREIVRTRDDHTCQTCGKVWLPNSGKRRHDVHHLNGFCGKKSMKVDKISEIDGLITLCHKCHFNHPLHSFKIAARNR